MAWRCLQEKVRQESPGQKSSMKIYGIVGYPLGHSCSPSWFNERFREEGIDAEYLPFEIRDIGRIVDIIADYPDLRGFNVTIPHKQSVLPFLDEISDEARAVGAVNCVKVCRKEGRPCLTGYNTDVHGFRSALLRFIPACIKKALILGNGGAAKAVRYALQTLGIDSVTVSRTPKGRKEIGYPQVADYIGGFPLIVNATPLGTWPDTLSLPDIPYERLTPGHYLFDLVYNPATTAFMANGSVSGAHVCNGYGMWLGQAEENRRIWDI